MGAIRSDVSKEKITKIQSALDTFGKFVSPENFIESMNSYTNKVVTPMMFQYSLIDTAKKARKKIVLPESGDPRILTATERLSKLGIVDIVLLGNRGREKIFDRHLCRDAAARNRDRRGIRARAARVCDVVEQSHLV